MEATGITYREIYDVLNASFPLYFPLGGEVNMYAANAADAVAALLERTGIKVKGEEFHKKVKKLRLPIHFV